VPNTFITPTVIAKTGIAHLYNTIVLAGLVWRDFDGDFAQKVGNAVNVRKPASFTAETFDRSAGATTQEATEDDVTITLDTIANVTAAVTDEEMTLEIENFSEQILTPAMEAIAQKVDGDLAELLVDTATSEGALASQGAGVASDAIRAARTTLSRNLLPTGDRNAVLSPEATGEALGDPLFVTANQSGSTDALREAIVGRAFGMATWESQVFGHGAGDRGQADGVAFHKSAVTLAVRPLDTPKGVAPNQATVENYKGLSLRVVYDYNSNKKQDEVSIDLLYGVDVTRAEGVVELDFGQGS